MKQSEIKNILLIQLGDIGDVVLTFPSIKALHDHFPHANIVVAVREKAKDLITDCCPLSTEVISVNKTKRGPIQELWYQKEFFSRLRSFSFDLAIDMRTGDRGAMMAFLSGATQRLGFYADDGKLWRNRLFTHLIKADYLPGQYMAEYYATLLSNYDMNVENTSPQIAVPHEKEEEIKAIFLTEKIPLNQPIIAIQPFSLWQYKEWGIEKYIELINRIGAAYHFPVIITGSPDEEARAEKIIRKCKENVYNFAGKTSIVMLAALLKSCSLFIGGDSAGIHIAAAVGTPTVSIFGPSSPKSWAPKGKEHAVVYKHLPCVPCREKGCQGSEVSRCLEELTVNEVMDVINLSLMRYL